MTRNLQRTAIGVTALVAAVVLLSMFAGSVAAANGVDSTADLNNSDGDRTGFNLSAAELDGQGETGQTVNGTVNITIDTSASSGDTIQLGLDRNELFSVDHFEFTDAEQVDPDTGSDDSADARVTLNESQGTGIGGDDAVNVTLTSDASDSADQLNVSMTIQVVEKVEKFANTSIPTTNGQYDDKNIVNVRDDQTGTGVSGASAAGFTLTPGPADRVVFDGESTNLDRSQYSDTDRSANVTIKDLEGNPVNDSVAESTDVGFTLNNPGVSGTIDDVTNQSNSGIPKKSINILNDTNGALQPAVNDSLEIQAGQKGTSLSNDTKSGITIAPDKLTAGVENSSSGGSQLNSSVKVNASDTGLAVNVSVVSTGGSGDSVMNAENISGTLNVQGNNINNFKISTGSDGSQTVTDGFANQETTGVYDVDPSILGVSNNSAQVTVQPATPAEIELRDPEDGALLSDQSGPDTIEGVIGENNDNNASVNVTIEDEFDNVVKSSGPAGGDYFTGDAKTTVKLTLEDETPINTPNPLPTVDPNYNPTDGYNETITFDGGKNGFQVVNITYDADTAGVSAMGAVVGESTLRVDQLTTGRLTNGGITTNLDEVNAPSTSSKPTARIFPEDVTTTDTGPGVVSNGDSASDADVADISVTLERDGGNAINGENVSKSSAAGGDDVKLRFSQNVSESDYSYDDQGNTPDLDIGPNGSQNASLSSASTGVITTSGTTTIDGRFAVLNEPNFGQYNVTAETQIDGSTNGSVASGQGTIVNAVPGEPTSVSSLSVNRTIQGTVLDALEGNVSVTVKVEDSNGNPAYYTDEASDLAPINATIAGDQTGDLEGEAVSGISKTSDTLRNNSFSDSDISDGVQDTVILNYNPENISNTTATGDEKDIIEVTYNTSSLTTGGSVDLVHETLKVGDQNLKSVSIPQKADVKKHNVDSSLTYDTSNDEYTADTDLDTSDGAAQVHNGFWVNGTSSDAYIGLRFLTANSHPDPDPADVLGDKSLNEGWNLVGTNQQLSSQTDVRLARQLANVDQFDASTSDNTKAYIRDTGLGATLDANTSGQGSSTTSDLTANDVVSTGGGNGDYAAFWVYVNTTSGFDNSRNLRDPEYNEDNRGQQLFDNGARP